jgi:hypothetical protein
MKRAKLQGAVQFPFIKVATGAALMVNCTHWLVELVYEEVRGHV